MTTKTDLPPIPPALFDVAMIDGPTSASAASISISSFLDGVRRTATGELDDDEVPYPEPAIRAPRCTRWLLADIRAWLIARASQPVSGDAVIERAKKASVKAREPAAVAKARATRKARIAAREGSAA